MDINKKKKRIKTNKKNQGLPCEILSKKKKNQNDNQCERTVQTWRDFI